MMEREICLSEDILEFWNSILGDSETKEHS